MRIIVFRDMTLFGRQIPAHTKQHGVIFQKMVIFNVEVNSVEI